MSYQELSEWYEYYAAEPFMSDRIEIQLATLSTMVGSFGGNKMKHKDFMISNKGKSEEILDQKEFENSLKVKFAGFTKKG